MAKRSDMARANLSPHTHVFIPGKGYRDMGELKDRPAVANAGLCNPPNGSAHMSAHMLKPPSGAALEFKWLPSVKSWYKFPSVGRRMAFPADYLSKAGWTYQGPASA